LSLTLKEEHRLRVFENRVLRGIFWPKRDEVGGGWRKLHNEDFHKLYSLQSIIIMIKPMRMRWQGHVACMERRGMHIGFWWESQKEKDHWENIEVGGRMLKWMLERQGGMVWTGLIWLRIGTSGGLL
jgi:hypothetical protein